MIHLRAYQEQCLAAIREGLTEHNRIAVEMATGLGKTITFAALTGECLADYRGQRVLVLVHTDELVRQAVEKIRLVAPRWQVGIVKAEANETTADIVVASVQTLANPDRRRQITDVGLIIVDECHHATSPTYRSILRHYGSFGCLKCLDVTVWPEPVGEPHWCSGKLTPTVGFTATLKRSDGAGLGQVWQDLVFSRSITWAQRHGYLVDLVPYTITVPDLELGSDAALDASLADSIAPEKVVEAWLEHGKGVSTVLFAPLVNSAHAFADAFMAAGVKAEVVHGTLPATERRAILERYEAGVTTVLCNAMVLTEGWDSPRTKCVIVARPTQSVPLFVQMVGRGLRPWLSAEAPPREDQRCILITLAGGTRQLATVADLSEELGEASDGKSTLQMADEFDLGKDIADPEHVYRGPVAVERWDSIVQQSVKAWKYTRGGVPFLPTAKQGQGYVFVVQSPDGWRVWHRGRGKVEILATAPDLELAMALAEDEAQERGGDIGRLIADKGRAWRKKPPSEEMIAFAERLGINTRAIVQDRRSGKAGRLSDLIDTVVASRRLDRIAEKIKERG